MEGRFRRPRCDFERRFLCTSITILAVVLGLIVFFVAQMAEIPRYSIAIDSVSGLDPDTDLGRPTLNPEFYLTMGVASRGFIGSQCIAYGTKVEVSYRGVLLATSEPAQHLCAEARKTKVESIHALGTGVHLPGFVRDSLAMDIRRGVQVYHVALSFPDSREEDLVSCGGRQVGDATSIGNLCDE